MPNAKKPLAVKKKFRGKVVMIGDSGVGKTSILLRHDGQGFTSCISTTLNASFLSSKIRTSQGDVELNLWDTAGQERFKAMLPMYTRNAVASIFVFDITRYDSFRALDYWIAELTRSVPNKVFKYVMANKCDLQDCRVVPESEGRAYATKNDALYFETSALNGRGIDMAMQTIAENLVQYHVFSTSESNLSADTSGYGMVEVQEEKETKEKHFCCSIS